jgi:flagellar hook-associated protein 2
MTTVASLTSSAVSTELQTVETALQKPITVLDNQVTTDKAEISAWGTISGAVSTLQTSLAGISNLATVNNLAATSTNTSTATATAALGAATGTYNIDVTSLATAQEVYTGTTGSAGATLSGGAGSLTITLKGGTSEKVSVGSGSLTLNGVAAAINTAAGGVKASVVSTTTGATLVLQGSKTGSSQAFSVSGTGALSTFDYSSTTGTPTEAAKNAVASINGVPITSTTNTLSSAISGVTVTLAGEGDSTISVSSSPSTLTSALSSVISSLSKAISTIHTETKYVASSASASTSSSSSSAKTGPLIGNFTATNLGNQLLQAISGAAASGIAAASLGVTVNSSGKVTFSSATFSSEFAKNPKAVSALVSDIYTSLDGITTSAIGASSSTNSTTGLTTKATTGFITDQTTSIQAEITSINSNIATLTKQDDSTLSNLATQYSNAEAKSSDAQITEEYLTLLNGSGSSKS